MVDDETQNKDNDVEPELEQPMTPDVAMTGNDDKENSDNTLNSTSKPNPNANVNANANTDSKHFLNFANKSQSYLYLLLFFLPVMWAVFIGVGWTRDDKIEEEVYNIWTRQRSDFAKDREYADIYDRNSLGASTFAAMAIARDGENLFTPERLEQIRLRMQQTEATTVEYKGNTYTWDDLCLTNNVGLQTTYEFPCARLSPMDFFQEARWFMDETDRVTWYNKVVKDLVVKPRLPRFGILQNVCSTLSDPQSGREECNATILRRVLSGDSIQLLADIGNLENNDPCKICIETEYEATMTQFLERTQQFFGGLAQVATQSGEPPEVVQLYGTILAKLDRQAIIDFFSYYVERTLYSTLGAETYMASRDQFNMAITGCSMDPAETVNPCPPPTTQAEAEAALANHADHTFSSTVTSGNPLPVWGNDGEGPLLTGTSPVGGSGIDMSGSLFSGLMWLQNPIPANFDAMVLTDPVYTWFVASETPMTASCGNGVLQGTSGLGEATDQQTAALAASITQNWCTKYNEPFEQDETRTVQHFARMWYDLLIDSPGFLNLVQGVSDPYVWTTGQGCGYDLAGDRYSYNDIASQEELMENVSGELYYLDEGETLGVIDYRFLMGGRRPQDHSVENPLEKVSVLQNIYPTLLPEDIVQRVKNCNRPNGSIDIPEKDAEEVLFRFKENFEETWSKGWDKKNDGEIAFVGFYDDSGVIGTTGRMLKEITLSNGDLIVVSIVIIAVFSMLFVISSDPVESRLMITLLGSLLVIFAFFAAVSFGLIVGIKINVTIAWTLPFIMLGLGVDDMYMVLLAVREQPGYTSDDFMAAIKEVLVPITMTSLVNAGMFALMCINDVPAIYLTAQVALISIIFLYLTIIFCFAAWCYVDMCRQAQNRYDVAVWIKREGGGVHETKKMWASFVYDKFYHPFLLRSDSKCLLLSHILIWMIAGTLLGMGIWGLTEDKRMVGLGLEDFFPDDNQASVWATQRTKDLSSWSIQMNWGDNDYSIPENQMRVIKQFEDVVASANVAEVDTQTLWLGDFLVWTTTHCTQNFDRDDANVLECGIDQVFPGDNTTCAGSWVSNSFGLREKTFSDIDVCVPYDGGICRPTEQMHPIDLAVINTDEADSWCPVFENWSTEKTGFCLAKWREYTGNDGRLVLKNNTGSATECDGEFLDDEMVDGTIPFAAGPTMFAFDLFTHEITIDMIEETRSICDDDPRIHCWLSGIPFDYWSQYLGIFSNFWEIGGVAVAAGFFISFIFLFTKLSLDKNYSHGKVLTGSLVGAGLIGVTTVLSLISVSGLSSLFDVSFTGFSLMSFVLSVGFAVEYSVHVVARWLMAPAQYKTSLERVEYAMEFLFLPTFMSFVSSTIGVACLAFTDFDFNHVFFFRPLIIVMFVTYFLGCWWLPVCLVLFDHEVVRFHADEDDNSEEASDTDAPKKLDGSKESSNDVSEVSQAEGKTE